MGARDLIEAMLASRGGPRREDYADDANPFARPHPDAGWTGRGLPNESAAWAAGRPAVEIGHEATRHDFPETPPAEPRPRRVSMVRPAV